MFGIGFADTLIYDYYTYIRVALYLVPSTRS